MLMSECPVLGAALGPDRDRADGLIGATNTSTSSQETLPLPVCHQSVGPTSNCKDGVSSQASI